MLWLANEIPDVLVPVSLILVQYWIPWTSLKLWAKVGFCVEPRIQEGLMAEARVDTCAVSKCPGSLMW